MKYTIAPGMLVGLIEELLQSAESDHYPALFQAEDGLRAHYTKLRTAIDTGKNIEQTCTAVTEFLSTSGIANEVFAVAIDYSLKVARSQIDHLRTEYPGDEPPPESARQFIRESLAPFILRVARKAELSVELIRRFERLCQ